LNTSCSGTKQKLPKVLVALELTWCKKIMVQNVVEARRKNKVGIQSVQDVVGAKRYYDAAHA